MRPDLHVIRNALVNYKCEADELCAAIPTMDHDELRGAVAALVKVQALSIELLLKFIEDTHAVISSR